MMARLDLFAVGLPPGVTMEAPRVLRGMKTVPVQFTAASDAAEAATSFAIHARAVDPGVTLITGSKQGFSFVNQSGGHAFHSVALDHFAIGGHSAGSVSPGTGAAEGRPRARGGALA